MPWKLVPPHTRKDGKVIHFWYVRGTYLGLRLDQSTGTPEERAAKTILATWRKQHERGEFRRKSTEAEKPRTFVTAALAYIKAGGDGRFIDPIIEKWRNRPLDSIDQIAIDTLADEIYPSYPATTKNRQFYTPVSSVLKHVGIEKKIKRPKGWRGKKSKWWLEPDQAFDLFREADKLDPEFGLLCRYLCYTGERLGEALRAELGHLRLERAFVYLPDSKNDEPRGIHLPPILVDSFRSQPHRRNDPVIRNALGHYVSGGQPVADAGAPFLKRSTDAKLFRFYDGGRLRKMLSMAMNAAGLSFPRRYRGFHIFCHTYGSWMTRYGKLDRYGLTRTGRWKDPDSADGYAHTEASEEARRADLLPTPAGGQLVDITKKTG